MADMIIIRSPQEIAAEINAIRRRAARQLLEDSVEVGRLLVEAKNSVQHGEWGDWLEENFQYSSTEANNLMRLYEAYGTREQIGLFEEDRTAIFGRLNKSQAIALLGLPEPERAAFVAENPPEEISVREWERKIEEARKEAYANAQEEWNGIVKDKESSIRAEAKRADEALARAMREQNARIDAENAARETAVKLSEADARVQKAELDAASARKLKNDLKEAKRLAETRAGELKRAQEERDKLQVRVDELAGRPPIVTVREPTAEERAAVEAKVREEIGAGAAELEDEVKRLRVLADPTVQKFSRLFDGFREAYARVRDLVVETGEEKYRSAMAKVLAAMSAEIGADKDSPSAKEGKP